MSVDISRAGIVGLRSGLVEHQFSCREIVDEYLEAIRKNDGTLGCFLHVDAEGAKSAAEAIDDNLKTGNELPALAGTVVAVKDNIFVNAMPSTAGSCMLEGYEPAFDATAVERLKAAGAIVIGKTNLDEYAMGASTEQSAFHPTKNPRDHARVPGGSSGGSAAAVAAGLCSVALGSDTGGSVRLPAAYCGVVGFRPTYGSVSRYGLVAMASSMDVIGPIGKSVEDCRQLLAVMGGHDPHDATSLPDPILKATDAERTLRGLRVGIPKEYFSDELAPEVVAALQRVQSILGRAGATCTDISLPSTVISVPTYYIITPAEVSSNLARYDGIQFGPIGRNEATSTTKLRDERFGTEVKRRVLLGTYVLSAGYADRYYHLAQRARTKIRQDFATAFADVDMLLTPTSPTLAFPFGSVQDPVSMYQQDVFLSAASLAGVPAISLPVPTDSLPVGAQIIGPQRRDADVLAWAQALETAMRTT